MKKLLVIGALCFIFLGSPAVSLAQTLTISQLQAIVASLQAQLNALIAQLNLIQQQENNRPIESIKPSITITSPNGGESYISGKDEINAKWSGYNLNGDAHYRIMLYSPTLGNVLQYDYPTQGGFLNKSLSFIIPSSITTGQYKINVCALNTERPDAPGKNVCDLSDNYFKITSGTSVNKSPIIGSIGTPDNNSLKVGEVGYWSVSAYDPDGDEPISYKVNCGNDTWGVRVEGEAGPHLSCVYKNPGVYQLGFVVTDTKGLSTEADRQVTVTSTITPSRASTINVKVLKGGIYCIKAPCEFPLAGATVTLYNSNKVLVGTQTASTDGSATFSGLAPGTYTVYGSATGYTRNSGYQVGLVSGQTGTVKFTLQLANTTSAAPNADLAAVLQSLQGVLQGLSGSLSH